MGSTELIKAGLPLRRAHARADVGQVHFDQFTWPIRQSLGLSFCSRGLFDIDVEDFMDFLTSPEFWVALGQIIIIDILLGGDNAVVIALACRNLPPNQRRWAARWLSKD